MPNTYKVLGQSCPTGTTETTLYTVPSNTQTVVSSIVVANITSTNYTYDIAVRPNGATTANQHYQARGTTIAANDSLPITIGITLGPTDVISVRSSNANSVAFSLYGCEITP